MHQITILIVTLTCLNIFVISNCWIVSVNPINPGKPLIYVRSTEQKGVVDLLMGDINKNLTCWATGSPLPTIHWEFTNRTIPDSQNLMDGNWTKSSITWAVINDTKISGNYSCHAINSLGTNSHQFQVEVKDKVQVVEKAKAKLSAEEELQGLVKVIQSLLAGIQTKQDGGLSVMGRILARLDKLVGIQNEQLDIQRQTLHQIQRRDMIPAVTG